ncbi:hypothetical protein [Paracoccus sp. ME4]|uniref:hypothetical protein n=1 Tax=Paracoccus sp. ME4 TaxID=3138066 RepID=UPI00398BB613
MKPDPQENAGNPQIAALVHEGMTRFPDGPPKSEFLIALQDRVNRLADAEDHAERDGIASALIISLRTSEEPAMRRSAALAEVAEALIDAANTHVALTRDRGTAEPAALATMRGLHNTLQAVYAAVVFPEELERDDAPDGP